MFCVSLITVLKHTLDSRGVTGQLKSRIRAEVHSALDDRVSVSLNQCYWKIIYTVQSQQPKPKLNDENFLINELIREYLQYNKYHYTNSVLSTGERCHYALVCSTTMY